MSVNKLLDVEEHVWSPMYGLKGNIDATVQVTMKDEHGTKTLTVPFELKTGKSTSNASHRAQTALYTLLLSDRYGMLFIKQTHTPDANFNPRCRYWLWNSLLLGDIRGHPDTSHSA